MPARILRLISILSIGLVLTACSHAVNIESDPPGAKVVVDGRALGEAPVVFNESTGWDKTYEIKATLPGYKTLKRNARQNQFNNTVVAFSIIPMFAGCLFAPIGFAWSRQLPDRIVLVLEPLDDTPSGGVVLNDATPSNRAQPLHY